MLKVFGMSKATALLSIILSNTMASELPNVVLIVADDLGKCKIFIYPI